jgi:hypothetical protein
MRPVKKIIPSHLSGARLTSSRENRGALHHALIESLGNYCSYCEMPLSDYHIEHVRYLAEWPEHATFSQWDDLLLICNDCRAHIRTPVLNELSAASMLWPDKDPSFALKNSPLLYQLKKVKYVVIDEDDERVSEENKELVFVVANPEAGQVLYQKAHNTISHFQLNMKLEYYDAATNELRVPLPVHMERLDNRMFKRTAAWFDAEASASQLKEMNSIVRRRANGELLQNAFIQQLAMTTMYSGNWSVWMTVLYQRTKDAALLGRILADDDRMRAGLNNDNNSVFRTE